MSERVTLVRAGKVVPAHDLAAIDNGAAAVRGELIEAVGDFQELQARFPGAEVMGGEEYLLIPGLINGHSHGRGLTDFQRGALDNTLESWLLDTRRYIPVPVYDDVAYSAARLLKAGVTTTMHNHVPVNPAAFEEEHDQAISAYLEAGMRVQFNPGVRNNNPFVYGDNKAFLAALPQELRQALTRPLPEGSLTGDNFVQAVKDLHCQAEGPRCRIGFGPLAPQWATRELLTEVRKAADELEAPIHVHAVQSIFQKVYGLEHLGRSLISWMNEIGFLGKRLVIGHCVWPTEADIELLARTGTAVTHHPSCNLRVRNGIAPAWQMLKSGVLVGLGLDGKSINDDDDLIQEMKVCYLLHRLPSLELHLEPGRQADLVLLDYQAMGAPYVDPAQDPIDVLLYRGSRHYVDTVMVGGRVVVEGGRLTTIDQEEIGRRLALASSRSRTQAEEAMLGGLDLLQEKVIDYYRGWTEKVETEPYMLINSRKDGLKEK
ncbi:MAG: amidohydrolase family protein [Deltaproteobacteria bacterium]|nr:amidohydrolase family protein [Deltaproteobacteria bacterium]